MGGRGDFLGKVGTSLSQQEQDGGQEGRDIPRGKEEGFAFTKKKKWRFSFVFYNKKGAEILKLRA